jgi:MHS family proline/betaine transporter-like MFS transporter
MPADLSPQLKESELVPTTKSPLSLMGILAGMSGNLMEWYDFALFGSLAPVLGQLFFPQKNHLASLISVFGIFAAGYVMRIVGGAFFGHIGDCFGRKPALLLSVGLMALSTALLGCLPNFANVGIMAPVLFVIMRIFQGVAMGGEFTTSVTYLIEHAPENRRAFYGSLTGVTAVAGILLGSVVSNGLFLIFTKAEVLAWGWRIPFLSSILLGLVILLLRRSLPQEERLSQKTHLTSPVHQVVREYPLEIIRGMFLGWGPHACFYIIAVFLGPFLLTEHLLPGKIAMNLQMQTIALMVVLAPLSGYLADKFGRKPMVLVAAFGSILLAWPLFNTLMLGNEMHDRLMLFLFALIGCGGGSSYQVWLAERFPMALRGSGLGIAYNGAAAFLSGTTPLLCTTLVELSGNQKAPAFLIILASVVTLFLALTIPETGKKPLI